MTGLSIMFAVTKVRAASLGRLVFQDCIDAKHEFQPTRRSWLGSIMSAMRHKQDLRTWHVRSSGLSGRKRKSEICIASSAAGRKMKSALPGLLQACGSRSPLEADITL